MTEPQQPKEVVIDVTPILGEAGFSLNWSMLDLSGNPVQVTMRGASAADWKTVFFQRRDFLAEALHGGWDYPAKPQKPAPQQAQTSKPAPAKPAAKPAAPVANGNGLTFAAEMLTVSINSGKTYYKVSGGKFKKFGVTVWPETLEAAGIDPNGIPNEGIDLTGYTAHYVTKDDGSGNPQKVVQLDPPEDF